MLRIGLTGGIASGKSTVGRIMGELGACVIDYDQVARDVVAPGTPGLARVVERFGERVLNSDGTLDRSALGRIVFADAAARTDLEHILHPAIRERAAKLEATSEAAVVVHEIPLLAESKLNRRFDEVIVVDIDPAIQVARVMERDRCDEQAAQARIHAQASRADRLDIATIVIANNGTQQELRRATVAVFRGLISRVSTSAGLKSL